MAAALPNNFVITKGVDNTFVFTIKQNGSTDAMVITVPGDTFTARLVDLSTEAPVDFGGGVTTKDLTVVDANTGRVQLLISAAEANGLVSNKGPVEDRYYLKPTYKLIIECNTNNNGNFIAKVPEVYVD